MDDTCHNCSKPISHDVENGMPQGKARNTCYHCEHDECLTYQSCYYCVIEHADYMLEDYCGGDPDDLFSLFQIYMDMGQEDALDGKPMYQPENDLTRHAKTLYQAYQLAYNAAK